MQLHIDPHDRSPVYRQIQHQIARAIAERRIPPGERLIDERALLVLGQIRGAPRDLPEDGPNLRRGRDLAEVVPPAPITGR